MAELTPQIVADVAAACKSGADEAAGALSRALDAQLTLSVGEPGKVDMQALPEGFADAGLVVVMTVGRSAALLLLTESSGLVPSWCADPDPTGQSKLATLAQELGMILLPEQFMPEGFKAAWVKSLTEAMGRGGVSDGAAMLPLELSGEGKKGETLLVWPASKPGSVIGAGSSKPKPKSKPEPEPAPKPKPKPGPEPAPVQVSKVPATIANLPNYARSLLRIRLPVVVTLARKRQACGQIVELGPGSIIQFEKSCEEMLDLDIGGRHLATGEAVKVGDKFGIRVNSMVLPEERFHRVKPPSTAGQETAGGGP